MCVLIKFESDWSDEFSVYAFLLIPNWSVKEAEKALKEQLKDKDAEYGFGTNEWFEGSRLDPNSFQISEVGHLSMKAMIDALDLTEESFYLGDKQFKYYGYGQQWMLASMLGGEM